VLHLVLAYPKAVELEHRGYAPIAVAAVLAGKRDTGSPNRKLQALAIANEHLDLRQLRDYLFGIKPLLCHRPIPFSKLNIRSNLTQKEPVTSFHCSHPAPSTQRVQLFFGDGFFVCAKFHGSIIACSGRMNPPNAQNSFVFLK
jgi:hypothetical protein